MIEHPMVEAASIADQSTFRQARHRARAQADRFGGAFSLVVFAVPPERRSVLPAAVLERARCVDLVGWLDRERLGVLLPYTGAEGAEQFRHDVVRTTSSDRMVWSNTMTYPEVAPDPTSGSTDALFAVPYPPWKRVLDLIGGAILLGLYAPFFLILALYIRVVSRGPLLYTQTRVGYAGRRFTLYKLRTMHPGNDSSSHREYVKSLQRSGRPMDKLDGRRDPRIIPGGRIIRGLALDEFPQLWNVLRGDMSLVGPRPCLEYEAEEFERWHAYRFDAMPGLTGLWQVSGKNRLSFQEMIRLDNTYAGRVSLVLDLAIILVTPFSIVWESALKTWERIKERIPGRKGESMAVQSTSTQPKAERAVRTTAHTGPVHVAVIGCGYWGPNLIRNFASLPEVRAVTACDLDRSRLEQIGSQYQNVRIETEYDEVLEDPDVDAVAIVTPVRTHFTLASRALEAGKHVFIEKPMAASVTEAERLIALASEHERRLMVGHTFVYNPTVVRIRELVEAGELGDVMYICSRRLNLGLFQQDINATWDLAPHDISIILYVLGKDPISVSCTGMAHLNPEVEDVTMLTLEFDRNEMAVIHSSWIEPRKVRETTIVGTRKMLVYDDTQPLEKIRIYDKRVEAPPHYDTFAEFTYSYHYGDVYSPYIKQVEPLKVEAQAFVDAIMRKKPSLSDGREGLRVVRVLEAASESLRLGGTPVRPLNEGVTR